MERAKRYWNGLRPLGTPAVLLERPKGYWNAPLANGTREALLERPPANGTRKALLERPPASWNARMGLVKNYYYTRATHGIVEVMWSNRGAFVERRRCGALQPLTREETFVSEAISDECECKITTFF